MEGEDEGLRSGRMKEIRESPSPEQSSDRKVRPVASRSFGTVRDRERKKTLDFSGHFEVFSLTVETSYLHGLIYKIGIYCLHQLTRNGRLFCWFSVLLAVLEYRLLQLHCTFWPQEVSVVSTHRNLLPQLQGPGRGHRSSMGCVAGHRVARV